MTTPCLALRRLRVLTMTRAVALACMALHGTAVTSRADPAPQPAPEQDRPASLLTQALDVLAASTDAAVESERSGREPATGTSASAACLARRTARL